MSWIIMTAVSLAQLSFADTASANDPVVPQLLELELATAEARAAEVGIELVVYRVEAPRRPGEVIDQIPEPGVVLGTDPRVWVQVSDGQTLPDLRGKARSDAEAELERLGIAWEANERPFQQVAPGLVGDIIPPPGTQIDPTSQVVFLGVSNTHLVVVPSNLVGLSHSQAIRLLEALGLAFSFDHEIRKDIITDCDGSVLFSYTVTASRPAPGTELPIGSTVAIELSESRDEVSGPACSDTGIIP
jgi:beta-lactam-binding protein with PASTA domain